MMLRGMSDIHFRCGDTPYVYLCEFLAQTNLCSVVPVCRAYKEKQKAKQSTKKPAAPAAKSKAKGTKAPKQPAGKTPGRVGGKR